MTIVAMLLAARDARPRVDDLAATALATRRSAPSCRAAAGSGSDRLASSSGLGSRVLRRRRSRREPARFPTVDRPVAPIISPAYSTEAERAAGEAERVMNRLGVARGCGCRSGAGGWLLHGAARAAFGTRRDDLRRGCLPPY